jgi:hypothetical protein
MHDRQRFALLILSLVMPHLACAMTKLMPNKLLSIQVTQFLEILSINRDLSERTIVTVPVTPAHDAFAFFLQVSESSRDTVGSEMEGVLEG